MIGNDVDTYMDAFPVDRGSAQLGVVCRSRSLAANGTEGMPSAVKRRPIST